MAKKIIKKENKSEKTLESNEVGTKKNFSLVKIVFVIIAGVIVGLLFTSAGPGTITKELMMLFIVTTLIACILALLLDVRRILLAKK